MKKDNNRNSNLTGNEMLPEYDFSGKQGIRGKYHQTYQQGHMVRICQDDGTVKVQYFTLEDGAVMLEPDIREYFPDSESVNKALRSLIALIPLKSTKKASFSGKPTHRSRL